MWCALKCTARIKGLAIMFSTGVQEMKAIKTFSCFAVVVNGVTVCLLIVHKGFVQGFGLSVWFGIVDQI